MVGIDGGEPRQIDQDSQLAPTVQGSAAPGAPQVHVVELSAGDVTSGTIELVEGGAIALEVFDPAGVRIEDLHQLPWPRGFSRDTGERQRNRLARTQDDDRDGTGANGRRAASHRQLVERSAADLDLHAPAAIRRPAGRIACC
jgi:hypothetical protein